MQQDDRDTAGRPGEDFRRGRDGYTRRIDCAPSPRRPLAEPAIAPHADPGSGSRAPGGEA
jgi:hypothetical protein